MVLKAAKGTRPVGNLWSPTVTTSDATAMGKECDGLLPLEKESTTRKARYPPCAPFQLTMLTLMDVCCCDDHGQEISERFAPSFEALIFALVLKWMLTLNLAGVF